MSEVRVLVCGGRNFDKRERVFYALSQYHAKHGPVSVLIEGEAPGADRLAAEWARQNGVPVEGFRADWQKHGRRAGPIRNQRMLDEGRPTVVIAFPGGAGTADMVRRAKAAGIPTHVLP